jgi:hypothetical protein
MPEFDAALLVDDPETAAKALTLADKAINSLLLIPDIY